MPSLPQAVAGVLLALSITVPARATEPDPVAAVPAPRPHHVYLVGDLLVSQPWLDLANPAAAEGYMIVDNRSDAPDRLVGASVTGAGSVSVAANDGGSLVVPPHGRLTLEPGAAHLSLHDVNGLTPHSAPVAGAVRFERAGTVHISFQTDRAAAVGEDPLPPPAAKPASPLQ